MPQTGGEQEGDEQTSCHMCDLWVSVEHAKIRVEEDQMRQDSYGFASCSEQDPSTLLAVSSQFEEVDRQLLQVFGR
jgi:hypothetical protein